MNSLSTNPTVASLFQNAKDDGSLDPAAMAVVNVPNFQATMQAAMGVHVDDVQASNVVLFTLLLDDSSSIDYANNTQVLIDGANAVIDAITATKEEGILLHIALLNGPQICPFTQLSAAPRVTRQNFKPGGLTPLYDRTAAVLGTVLARTQDFQAGGVPVRSVTLIVTDGADVNSQHHRTPEAIAPAIAAMVRAEQHIVSAMGIDDGSTDFNAVFSRAGIQPKWILTPKNDPREIRQAFIMASRSAARASVAATGNAFSNVAAGGFV